MIKFVLKRAIANILFKKLIENFDDLEGLSEVQTSKEFDICEQVKNLLVSEKESSEEPECVDYELVVCAWNTLYEKISDLNEKNEALLKILLEKFELKTSDTFMLFGSLVGQEVKIGQKLNGRENIAFREYVSEANGIIRDFKIKLLTYLAADLTDNFLDNREIINPENIKYERIDLAGTIIYLDQNAVTSISDDSKFMGKCLDAKADNKIHFVYSPYLAMDSVNMNPFFLKDFVRNLFLLSSNCMISIIDNVPNFVREDVYHTFNRAHLYSHLSKTFESHWHINVIRHYHDYPELRKGRALNNELIKDPLAFFRGLSKSGVPGSEKVVSKFSGSRFVTPFLETGKVPDTPIEERCQLIEELLRLFDFINFETESVKLSNAKKISSSYRDNNHLTHASIAGIFVTDDKRLTARAKLLYSLVGIHTKVMNFKEFREKISKSL